MKRRFSLITAIAALIIAAAAVCAFSQAPASAAKSADLKYYAVDVGQGDCSLFMLPDGKNIVVDAGPADSAEQTVTYLKACGVKKIDLLVATHPHEDHIGGMEALISNFKIGKIWDSGYNHGSRIQKNFYQAIKDNNIRFGRPKRGFSEDFGKVKVSVVGPAKTLTGTHSDANNNSLILKLTYGNISFLMMGDAEREERASIGALPQADILKAGHHGSHNGTDKKLLREVAPSIIILSYARGNSYGHPHKEVVNAVRAAKILRFDTADGTVMLRTNGRTITYEKKRVVQ